MKGRKSDSGPFLIERRAFLSRALQMAGAATLGEFLPTLAFGGTKPPYALAPESLLPEDIRKAPEASREAYRFVIANRDILRYIPCYCGCLDEGHTSNASCYLKDFSTPGNLVFDRMSLN
jgi:hypothetical protein